MINCLNQLSSIHLLGGGREGGGGVRYIPALISKI